MELQVEAPPVSANNSKELVIPERTKTTQTVTVPFLRSLPDSRYAGRSMINFRSKMMIFQGRVISKKFVGYVLLAVFSVLYFCLSVRYPIWNFDDLYYYGHYKNSGWAALKAIFLGMDIPSEYRTYSFSRSLQFVLLNIFGDAPFAFYALMAATHLASGGLIYLLIKRAAKNPASFSPEGFGCSVIWILSPFSIVHTFHHFSYQLLPFFFLLVYIHALESSKNKSIPKAFLASTVLVIICISGEAMLPALFAYLFMKLYKRPRSLFFLLQVAVALAVLVAHYFLLDYFNSYSSRQTRFLFLLPSSGNAVFDNLGYFLASVGSLISQGMHLTAKSFDPYYPGYPIYSFAWRNLSPSFFLTFALLILILALALKILRDVDKNPKSEVSATLGDFMDGGTFLVVAVFVFSLWGVYLVMTVSGAKLYGTQYALQIRYGHVVIPMSFCLLFLAWRRLIKNRSLHSLSWSIPFIAAACWLAAQVIVAPLNAAQNHRVIAILHDAYEAGIRIIRLEHPNFPADPQTRPFGITNPFVRWGESPFQQDWTTDAYLRHFLGVMVYREPLLEFDTNYFLEVKGNRGLLEKKLVASVGSKSLGIVPHDYPREDIYIRYGSRNRDGETAGGSPPP